MSKWRRGLDTNMVPVQQSLTEDHSEYTHYQMSSLMLGVVLEVYPSDSENNRSAHQNEARRGFLAEAKVLLVGTNASANVVLDHVVITTSNPSGLNDFVEDLPRPSTNQVSGEDMRSSGAHIDPFDLDGDWCVVGFIGGSLDQPFIITWWPHPRNAYDQATSGAGNPDSQGKGQSLDQRGRHFKRQNGVETVITREGDVVLSTKFANAKLKFDGESTEGRWSRELNEDTGGSILVQVKPSQTFELAWDEAIDGLGILGQVEDQLPQTNPRTKETTSKEREKTYVRIDSEELKAKSDVVQLESFTRITLYSEDEATIGSETVLTLDSNSIKLGEDASTGQGVVRGQDLFEWLSSLTVLTPMGPASINPADIATFISDTVSTKVTVE